MVPTIWGCGVNPRLGVPPITPSLTHFPLTSITYYYSTLSIRAPCVSSKRKEAIYYANSLFYWCAQSDKSGHWKWSIPLP